MSFVRTKTIKGRDYLYRVENLWQDGRVRQHVIEYLGPAERVYAARRAEAAQGNPAPEPPRPARRTKPRR